VRRGLSPPGRDREATRMRLVWLSLLWSTLSVLVGSPAHAHGTVGQRTFIEPFVTEDANPKNEFFIAKPGFFNTREGNEFSLGFSLEKKLSEHFSLALEGAWTAQRVGGASNSEGFQNPGLLLEYSLWTNRARESSL